MHQIFSFWLQQGIFQEKRECTNYCFKQDILTKLIAEGNMEVDTTLSLLEHMEQME